MNRSNIKRNPKPKCHRCGNSRFEKNNNPKFLDYPTCSRCGMIFNPEVFEDMFPVVRDRVQRLSLIEMELEIRRLIMLPREKSEEG